MTFHFNKNTITFDFDGKVFEIEAAGTTVWLQKSVGVFDNARKIFAGAMKANELTADQIEGVIREFVQSFDELLGDGATAQIFGERPVSFFDCCDMYNYITAQIVAFGNERMQAAVPSVEDAEG